MHFDTPQFHTFHHEGVDIAYFDSGVPSGEPILLIHGFASSALFNWVHPGWLKTLGEAGYRVIAIDNRGHGKSSKLYDSDLYTPMLMAADAVALLDHLNIHQAHIMGYSMGARISAFLAVEHPDRATSVIMGGLGDALVTGLGDWDAIADALLAPSLDVVEGKRNRMFRQFADQTGSDKQALAACIRGSRTIMPEAMAAAISRPVLIAVGTEDDIAGSPQSLADMIPDAIAVDIPRRDHMLAVGDKVFKAAALEFLEKHSV